MKNMIIKKRNSLQTEVSSKIGFNNIITGYIIDIIVVDIGSDKFFDIVFKKKLKKVIANSFVLPNAEQIFREALTQTRASLSTTARDHLYNTTMNNLKLVLNSNGTFSIEIAK